MDITIPDSLSIAGYLFSNPTCNSVTQGGDTLIIKTREGLALEEVSPAVTDSNGHFMFNPFELARLSDTLHFAISTNNYFSVDAIGYHTKSEWIALSPMNINIEKLHKMWEYANDTNQSIYISNRSLILADNLYSANSSYNYTQSNRDVVLQKTDSAGNQIWQIDYDYSGNDDLIDVAIGDSSKTYMLVASDNANPRTRIIVYNNLGQQKWVAEIDMNDPKRVLYDGSGYVYVVGNSEPQNSNCRVYRVSSTGNIDWYFDYDGMVDFESASILGNGNIVVITKNSNTESSWMYSIDRYSGQIVNSDNIGITGYYANNIIDATDSTYFIAGNYQDNSNVVIGGKIDFNSGLQDYINESGTIEPSCMIMDSEGNLILLYKTNIGFKVACYDTTRNLIWETAENGDWFAVAEKLVLRLDHADNVYVLLALNDVENKEYSSHLFSFSNRGEKIWEQTFESITLFDFAVSENLNIYVNGIEYVDGTPKLILQKYAQCFATAYLKSHATNNSSTNEFEPKVELYPNPNNGNMTLEYSITANTSGVFELYDYTGRKIFDKILSGSNGKLDISIPNLVKGIYMYKVTSDKNVIGSGKVVIIR
jgi:hypothetical protein